MKSPRENLSLQYRYNFKQTSDENKEKYQFRGYYLIQKQILRTKIMRVYRITNEILEVKGLIETNIVNKHRAKILTGRRRTKRDKAGQTKKQIQ